MVHDHSSFKVIVRIINGTANAQSNNKDNIGVEYYGYIGWSDIFGSGSLAVHIYLSIFA